MNDQEIMTTQQAQELSEQKAATIAGESLQQALGQMTQLVILLEGRLSTLERVMNQHVTITSGQAKIIKDAVIHRAREICETKGLNIGQAQKVRAAIWRAFRAEYAVPSPYDLPAAKYHSALESVFTWMSYAFIQQLKRQGREQV